MARFSAFVVTRRSAVVVLAVFLSHPLPQAAADPLPQPHDEFDLIFPVAFRPQNVAGSAFDSDPALDVDLDNLLADLLLASECTGSLHVQGSYEQVLADTIESTSLSLTLPQSCPASSLRVWTEVADFGLPVGAQKMAQQGADNPSGAVVMAQAGTGQTVPIASVEYGAHGPGSRLEWTFTANGSIPSATGALYGELCVVATAFNGGKINVYTHSCAELLPQ